MNAPLLWIGLPFLLAIVFFFLRDRPVFTSVVPGLACLFFSGLAFVLPVGETIDLGLFDFEIATTMQMLGRRFVIDSSDINIVAFLYLFAALWFLGASVARTHRYFSAFGMAIISFFVAALSVEPFLYAALLIEIAMLFSVPMLVPMGKQAGLGLQRYLIFQTLGMVFILFAGWAMSGVEANPANERLLLQSVVLVSVGFAFWLAVFPFYTWVPMMVEETHPYIAGFILSMQPTVVLLLMLKYMDTYSWLRNFELLPQALQLTGMIMVVTGGAWAAFQSDLRRMFGYAVIIESGFSIIALAMQSEVGYQIYVSMFLPRLAAYIVWALAMSILARETTADLRGIRGMLHHYPFVSSALLLSMFSLSGLPLLAGFPARLTLFENLTAAPVLLALWVFIGNAGFLLACVRVLAALTRFGEETWQVDETWQDAILLIGGIAGLFVLGIFPRFFSDGVLALLNSFTRLF
ncbi:MAG: hypothetical protein GYA17_05125 [Chloroflexi bacterium]|nr:proton-conducting transporter membrane subunit [Anaerolineaceae bacterium]NMB87717.1 hypothetical protein [Chloroflexota bacterium]